MTAIMPYLTADIPPLGGVIKTAEEDFFVEELPLYPPCGQGTHVYFQIEKVGIPTMEALSLLARALGIAKKDIGYAGLKDARAIARQWISVEHIQPEKVRALNLPHLKILQIAQHTNKLKIGHLSRNRFVVRLRDFDVPLEQAAAYVEAVFALLTRKGVPNYFGEQRFGVRQETHMLGEALAKGQIEKFVDIFLGRPQTDELDTFAAARSLYDQGEYRQAHEAWPYSYSNQRRALKALIDRKGNKKSAYHAVDKRLKSLFVSAYQSSLFNQVLAARMPHIDRLFAGDMAYKHCNGACFKVEDAAVEQPRCDALEISPTGPLLGARMTCLTGPAGEIENPILERAGLQERDLQQMDSYGGRGGRRPLRFIPYQPQIALGANHLGPYLQLQFELDSGCYATTLIREITKSASGCAPI